MRKLKKLIAVMCMIAILASLITITPIVTQAASGDITYRTVNWNGQEWELHSTENANGELATVYYMKEIDDVNENRIQYTIWEI